MKKLELDLKLFDSLVHRTAERVIGHDWPSDETECILLSVHSELKDIEDGKRDKECSCWISIKLFIFSPFFSGKKSIFPLVFSGTL